MGKPTGGTTSRPTIKGTRGDDSMEVVSNGVIVNGVLKAIDPAAVLKGVILNGDAGNDVLRGGAGADEIYGGGGNDVIFGLPDDIKLDGGAGFDTLDLSQATGPLRYLGSFCGQLTYWPDPTPASYTIATGFERVIGGAYSDYLFGSSFGDTLEGGGGGDYLEGKGGNDVLTGGAGADFFQFSTDGSGADRVTDFEYGLDHLFFYGTAQPDLSKIFVQGDDLVVPWANGTVTLAGMGYLDPSGYADLFTLSNGELSVVV